MNQVTKKREEKKYCYTSMVDEMLCTDDDDVGGIWIKL
jgi:hypothetical protein